MELNNEYEEARAYLKKIEACVPGQRDVCVEESEVEKPVLPVLSQQSQQTQQTQSQSPLQQTQQSQQHISLPSREPSTQWILQSELETAIRSGETGVVDELVFSSDSDGSISDEEECIVVEHYNVSSDYCAERIPSKEDEYEIHVEEQSDSQEEVLSESQCCVY